MAPRHPHRRRRPDGHPPRRPALRPGGFGIADAGFRQNLRQRRHGIRLRRQTGFAERPDQRVRKIPVATVGNDPVPPGFIRLRAVSGKNGANARFAGPLQRARQIIQSSERVGPAKHSGAGVYPAPRDAGLLPNGFSLSVSDRFERSAKPDFFRRSGFSDGLRATRFRPLFGPSRKQGAHPVGADRALRRHATRFSAPGLYDFPTGSPNAAGTRRLGHTRYGTRFLFRIALFFRPDGTGSTGGTGANGHPVPGNAPERDLLFR